MISKTSRCKENHSEQEYTKDFSSPFIVFVAEGEGMSTTNAERRGMSRKPPRGKVNFECRKGVMGLGPNIGLSLWDISQTGACIVTKPGIAIEDEVEISITTTGLPRPLKMVADVVWVEPLDKDRQSVGVRFHKGIPFSDLAKLTS